jgi:hypothetical protein
MNGITNRSHPLPLMADDYVIWSFEHTAWWRPRSCGYTPHLYEAGHYSQAEADAIVADANIVSVNEWAIRYEDAVRNDWNTMRRR